jgi:hypothetical protein
MENLIISKSLDDRPLEFNLDIWSINRKKSENNLSKELKYLET